MDVQEEIGFHYELSLTPVKNGEDTTHEHEMLLEYIIKYARGKISFNKLDFYGHNGIDFKSIKSLDEL